MKHLILAAGLAFSTLAAHAVDIAISAQEAYNKIKQGDPKVLLIDVRDPMPFTSTFPT